ncbi:hypothetical protein Ccrd_006484 [Cynara cardunculus var. scolymus]|uniref:Uncharacterized protein n=1 Tax=Cynara cardunculus var. scolymus TaxID=59895 RepID=A0A103XIP4_CYNCS|nr:hypothetical protein Ccrd_006484 [Cynara cardunculus var. scolymus]
MAKSFTLIQTVATAGLFSAVSFWCCLGLRINSYLVLLSLGEIMAGFCYQEN